MKNRDKTVILENICYSPLVYGRICKKLDIQLSNEEIEQLIQNTLQETEIRFFEKIGKNYYITNLKKKIRITVNSQTYRVITVDKIKEI